jgi:hypothetical protein
VFPIKAPLEDNSPAQRQRALSQEVQDRFGPLYLDLKGSGACFMFGSLRPVLWAARGVLIGIFLGECGLTLLQGCAAA